MSKLLAAIVATTFAFAPASVPAADTAKKKEELTKEQRADMRNRAEKLTAERAKPTKSGPTAGAKKQELTQEERAELRNRAERLRAERDRGVTPAKTKPDARAAQPKT